MQNVSTVFLPKPNVAGFLDPSSEHNNVSVFECCGAGVLGFWSRLGDSMRLAGE